MSHQKKAFGPIIIKMFLGPFDSFFLVIIRKHRCSKREGIFIAVSNEVSSNRFSSSYETVFFQFLTKPLTESVGLYRI